VFRHLLTFFVFETIQPVFLISMLNPMQKN
jgi:hypothetical protein